MIQRMKAICLIVVICTALGIALFISWNWIDRAAEDISETLQEETHIAAETQETLFEEILPVLTEETTVETEFAEMVPLTVDTVPQYFQTDYPDVRYGTGTIADSGCNMTALAMVASYMTDHVYYPDEIAD